MSVMSITVPLILETNNLYDSEQYEKGLNIATNCGQVYIIIKSEYGTIHSSPTSLQMGDLTP